MAEADDRTLDELRLALAPEVARAAVFDGWTDEALNQAAALAGVDANVARLAFSGGAMDMLTYGMGTTWIHGRLVKADPPQQESGQGATVAAAR